MKKGYDDRFLEAFDTLVKFREVELIEGLLVALNELPDVGKESALAYVADHLERVVHHEMCKHENVEFTGEVPTGFHALTLDVTCMACNRAGSVQVTAEAVMWEDS